MIVVGLDLSLTCTGIATLHNLGVDGFGFETHRVKSVGRKGATVNDTAERIALLVRQIIERIDPATELAIIESPSFGSNGGAAHERGGLWWGVAARLYDMSIPIATVAPKTRAIYAVGHGSGVGTAGKREVKEAVQARYANAAEIPDDNVADAVVLAAMGARHLGMSIDELPTTHLRAMESAKWPN